MVIELKSNSAIAHIDTKGAELVSLQDVFGVEYMWQKDAKYWNRSSPVLFPVVGNLRNNKTIIEGKEYEIPKHGFCRDAEFKVMFQSETKVILNYSYNEETLAVYPYKFSLSLTYSLDGGQLEIGYTVLNLGETDMDYCLGAHPAFNVPLTENETFEDYCLEFNKEEPVGYAVYDCEKLEINPAHRVDLLKGNKKIMLKNNYFDDDAIIFDEVQSDSVKLYSIKSGRGVEVHFKDFEAIAFWTPTKLNAPFLCIEPWNGMAVRSDEDNQYTSKKGIQHLKVNEQHNFKLTIIPM
ncbi:aldose 1-epimerase family protein [Paludicola sp. MB14-C6]|uniref:aldose 1-epimerase family protein n=1 Tax=Paludihabitans sp. MB14-C6 TaxID=3070656 RepID=UPI0027DB3E24|nr:aldose 1-epimerase family protein [Paludicola sp. MB14-C6]WMJ23094.1 aldose 1-epimerase family protein [Paludicola sp. MB14-C6]